MSCRFDPCLIKINESYWWDVLIERTDPRINVKFSAWECAILTSDAPPFACFRGFRLRAHPAWLCRGGRCHEPETLASPRLHSKGSGTKSQNQICAHLLMVSAVSISDLGHAQISRIVRVMSVIPLKTDVYEHSLHVR